MHVPSGPKPRLDVCDIPTLSFFSRSSPLDKNAPPDHSMSLNSFCRYTKFHLPRNLTHNFSGSTSWKLTDGLTALTCLNTNGGFDMAENIHSSIHTPSKTIVLLYTPQPTQVLRY